MTILRSVYAVNSNVIRCCMCGTRRGTIYEFGDYMHKRVYATWRKEWERRGKPDDYPRPEQQTFYSCEMCHMLYYLWPWYFDYGRLPRSKIKLAMLKLWKKLRRVFFDTRG